MLKIGRKKFTHSSSYDLTQKQCGSDGGYGENLHKSSGSSSALSAVKSWYSEISYYDFTKGTCNDGECRHFTALLWEPNNIAGFGRVYGSSGTFVSWNGGSDHGTAPNMSNQYTTNLKPVSKSQTDCEAIVDAEPAAQIINNAPSITSYVVVIIATALAIALF